MTNDPLSAVKKLTSVAKVLEWIQANGMAANQLDLIQQDEFSSDLLIAWQDGWLSFGLT